MPIPCPKCGSNHTAGALRAAEIFANGKKFVPTAYGDKTPCGLANIFEIESGFDNLVTAAEIAQTTLETIHRERDPKNIAAKLAAERLGKALA